MILYQKKKKKINIEGEINEQSFLKEANSLQTMYGKEGVIGLAHRYLKKLSI